MPLNRMLEEELAEQRLELHVLCQRMQFFRQRGWLNELRHELERLTDEQQKLGEPEWLCQEWQIQTRRNTA